jgi:hypothetical protein
MSARSNYPFSKSRTHWYKVPAGPLSRQLYDLYQRRSEDPTDWNAVQQFAAQRVVAGDEIKAQRREKHKARLAKTGKRDRSDIIYRKPDYERQLYIKRARAQEEARQKRVDEYNIHKAHKPGGSEYEQARQRFADGYSEERKKSREEYIKSLYAARKKPTGKLRTT